MKPFICSLFTVFKRLGRDFVAPKLALITHTYLQLPEDLAESTPDFADRFRCKVVAHHDSRNVFSFPGGFFNMPVRNFRQVFAAYISFFEHLTYLLPPLVEDTIYYSTTSCCSCACLWLSATSNC